MKTKFRIRLILSSLMLGLTAVTLTTSTFAWFATNRNAWFDEIELEIGNTQNLLISVDGSSYRSAIPSNMIKRAVVAKKNNLQYNASDLDAPDFLEKEWNKISLEPITTCDLETFETIEKKDYSDDENENFYKLVEADKYTYLQFDAWFIVKDSKASTKQYDLKFVNNNYVAKEALNGNEIKTSYVTALPSTILLYNDLVTPEKTYSSGETIEANCEDAMRVGITRLEQKSTEDIQKFIFEPNEGLGSYALDSCLDTNDSNYYKFDPNKNAMFTYFNNLNEKKLKPLVNKSETNKDMFDYINNVYRDGLQDDVSFGEIVPNATSTAYQPVKLTITVWLEGFDADYIIGMYNTSLKLYLNFYVEEKNYYE